MRQRRAFWQRKRAATLRRECGLLPRSDQKAEAAGEQRRALTHLPRVRLGTQAAMHVREEDAAVAMPSAQGDATCLKADTRGDVREI